MINHKTINENKRKGIIYPNKEYISIIQKELLKYGYNANQPNGYSIKIVLSQEHQFLVASTPHQEVGIFERNSFFVEELQKFSQETDKNTIAPDIYGAMVHQHLEEYLKRDQDAVFIYFQIDKPLLKFYTAKNNTSLKQKEIDIQNAVNKIIRNKIYEQK